VGRCGCRQPIANDTPKIATAKNSASVFFTDSENSRLALARETDQKTFADRADKGISHPIYCPPTPPQSTHLAARYV